jgi:hypothetical protein
MVKTLAQTLNLLSIRFRLHNLHQKLPVNFRRDYAFKVIDFVLES